ncbi:hypothetical protein HDU91_000211, partial [Kappamyces sp. JEL0680]
MPDADAAFVTFNWITSECRTAPSSVLFYQSESQSVGLQMVEQYADEGFDSCGGLSFKTIAPESCCFSAITPSEILGYKGFAGAAIGNFTLDTAATVSFPASSVATEYCAVDVSATDMYNDGNLTFSVGAFLGSNRESCLESWFACKDSALYIYPQADCEGSPEIYPINATATTFDSSGLGGHITVLQLVPKDPTVTFDWIENYAVDNFYVSFTRSPYEGFCSILMCLSQALVFGAFLLTMRLYYANPAKRIRLLFASCFLVWNVYLVVEFMVNLYPIPFDSLLNQ